MSNETVLKKSLNYSDDYLAELLDQFVPKKKLYAAISPFFQRLPMSTIVY